MSNHTVENTKHNRQYITTKQTDFMSLTNLSASLSRPSIKAQESGSFNDLFLEFVNRNSNNSGIRNVNGSEREDDFGESVFRSIILNIDVYVVPLVSKML